MNGTNFLDDPETHAAECPGHGCTSLHDPAATLFEVLAHADKPERDAAMAALDARARSGFWIDTNWHFPAPPAIDRLPLLDADHEPLTRRERITGILRGIVIAPVVIAAFWLFATLMMGCEASDPCAADCAAKCAKRGQLVERYSGCGDAGCQCEEEQ